MGLSYRGQNKWPFDYKTWFFGNKNLRFCVRSLSCRLLLCILPDFIHTNRKGKGHIWRKKKRKKKKSSLCFIAIALMCSVIPLMLSSQSQVIIFQEFIVSFVTYAFVTVRSKNAFIFVISIRLEKKSLLHGNLFCWICSHP